AAVAACYHQTDDPELRTRCQMVLLASEQDLSPAAIAPVVRRSHDTVVRVLQRFQQGGLLALPRGTPPGATPTVTAAWQAELQRVIELDPHTVGVASANWTTQLLADYLAGVTGLAGTQETVRRYLHRLGYVCKRPGWTLAH